MPRKRRSRLYVRERGGERRFYGDFRDYADVGGGREALIPEAAEVATTDQVIAEALVAERLKELQERRRNKKLLGVERQSTLAEFAEHHLIEKRRAGKVTEAWIERAQVRLEDAVRFFGGDRDLASITVRDVQRWAAAIGERPGKREGSRASGQTIRHYLNALSNLYRRAQSEGYVQPGYNPVAAMMEKPTPRREEARWLEVHEAAWFLDAARRYEPTREDGIQCVYPLIATFLLTGGRMSEVLGLEVGDISFERSVVTFRPNSWRRLKTLTSHRSVPLWPQLHEILLAHLESDAAPQGTLLFPSAASSEESMIVDLRKMLDGVAKLGGWKAGEIRSKMFRHTYCAARLQTLDHGAPVSPYTVGKEMGHGGDALVKRVYGHLGQVRHRSDAVEYRVEQHSAKVKQLLKVLKVEASDEAGRGAGKAA